MKLKLDEMDRAILDCLRRDGRMPAAEIARQLGYVSSRAVRNRIRSLIETGVIAITARAIPRAVGYGIRADIAIEVEPGKVREVAEALAKVDVVYYVAITTGDCDVSAAVVAADIEDLQTFITGTLHSIPGVQRTRTFVLTNILKEICDWPFPAEVP
jgi:Lrp/AsnC family transcriptional regulator for asnA, asnC and gidA